MSAFDQLRYFDIMDNLTAFYGDDEVKRICSQYGCEYEPTFFGFLDLYDGVARALHGRKKISTSDATSRSKRPCSIDMKGTSALT